PRFQHRPRHRQQPPGSVEEIRGAVPGATRREAIAEPRRQSSKKRAKNDDAKAETAKRERVVGQGPSPPGPLSRAPGEGEWFSGLAIGGTDRGRAGFGGGFAVAGAALTGDEVEFGLGLFQAE